MKRKITDLQKATPMIKEEEMIRGVTQEKEKDMTEVTLGIKTITEKNDGNSIEALLATTVALMVTTTVVLLYTVT